MKPTVEQESILSAARESRDNLLISALAGAAKTTTLKMIAEALPSQPILLVVFNRRIAEEAERKLPGHVRVATMNSIGHRVWAAATGKRLTLDTKKSYTILQGLSAGLDRKQRFDFEFAETLALLRTAKQAGYIPRGSFDQTKRIISDEEFFSSLDEEPTNTQTDILHQSLVLSIKQSYAGSIDYDDQIYMPSLFGGTFPQFPLTLVDEAQDLSILNHTMLEKLVRQSRLIAVGDHFQSIYAFRGAHSRSMSFIRNKFNCKEMTLSVSFRCPRAVVRNAHWRAPTMQWVDDAQEGQVEHLSHWSAADIPEGAAILCRNNAPLFALAMRLLRAGRGCTLAGTDIGPALIKILKKLGEDSDPQEKVLKAIDRWEAERLERSRAKASVKDKSDCLRVFAGFGSTLTQAAAYAEHLFQSRGTISLLSGHKAKGLEWDVVYHLDPWRIPSQYATTEEDLEQERNIRYVIETRAKQTLRLVSLEDFSG